MRRLAAARAPSPGVDWAWRHLVETSGRVPIGSLADELGWSRKRIVARFREQVGLPPKAVARLLRFDRARTLAQRPGRPDWARIAVECGYFDQSHLINDFRAVTGRPPETFSKTASRRRLSLRLHGHAHVRLPRGRSRDGRRRGPARRARVTGGRPHLPRPAAARLPQPCDGRRDVERLRPRRRRRCALRAGQGRGATIIEEPTDLPFGHRRYGCVDPQGHEWFFTQPIGSGG